MAARHLPIFILMLLLVPASLSAQAPAQRSSLRPAVGGELGYSRSDLGGSDAERVQSRQGALTGVYVQRPIKPTLFLRTEILFALKVGRAQTTVDSGVTRDLDIELAYIELPVLLRIGPTRGRYRPMFFGGAATSLQIGCDLQLIDPNSPVREVCSEAGIADFRQIDFGLVVGGGLEIRWPQSAMALEARYTGGVRSVLEGADVKNRAFAVVLTLTF